MFHTPAHKPDNIERDIRNIEDARERHEDNLIDSLCDERELWLCEDCTQVAVNDDASGIDSVHRWREVRVGVIALGSGLTPDFADNDGEIEFSDQSCDCCGSLLAGSRRRFVLFA